MSGPFRQCAEQLVEYSVATGQTLLSFEEITSVTPATIAWLTRLGVVQDGRVADMFVSLQTVLEKPALQTSCDSRLSIKRDLDSAGWQKASGRDASIPTKKYNSDAPLEYFLIIKHHPEKVADYDQKYGLRHAQSRGYYETLRCCFARTASDS